MYAKCEISPFLRGCGTLWSSALLFTGFWLISFHLVLMVSHSIHLATEVWRKWWTVLTMSTWK